jgi:hypothetical protein
LFVDALEEHFDFFVFRGRQVFAYVIGADRKFPMASIQEHCELDPRGAPE